MGSTDILLGALLIVFFGLAAYSNSLNTAFVYDDIPSIVENPTIRNLWSMGSWLNPPNNIASRPVLNLTLAINYAISSEKVWSYHAANVIFHIIAGLLLFGIVRRTLIRLDSYKGIAGKVALSCALIWLVHPIQTQAITYTIQRCESLMGMFSFLTLYCAIRGWESRSSEKWHAFAVMACVLGMGVKEAMIVTPVLVFLYDFLFFRRSIWRAFIRYRLLYIGMLSSVFVLAGMIVFYDTIDLGRESLPFTAVQYLLTQSQIICHYLYLVLWPDHLILVYNWPIAEFTDVIPSLIFMACALTITIWALVRRHPLSYPAGWFFVTLAPSSSIIPIKHLIFEHRMYLPLAGLCVLAVIGGYSVFRRLGCKRGTLPVACCALVVVMLGLRTYLRNMDYRTPLSLWEATYASNRDLYGVNADLENAVGHALLGAGRIQDAMSYLHRSIALDPTHARAYINLGIAFYRQKKFDSALFYFNEAKRLNPKFAKSHMNIGSVMAQMGQLEEAIPFFKKAIMLNPFYAEAHYNLGKVYVEMSQTAQAIDQFRLALNIQPNHLSARLALGIALSQTNCYKMALTQLKELAKRSPDYPGVHRELGFVLLKLDLLDAAAQVFRAEMKLHPSDIGAYNGLAMSLARTGKMQAALKILQSALEIDPGDEVVRKNIARLNSLKTNDK
jgi:tetratricopeptide (TPR) repeat protein